MNLDAIKKTILKSAQDQLALHQNLGQRSRLTVMQVAELWDIVAGKSEKENPNAGIFFDNTFSLN